MTSNLVARIGAVILTAIGVGTGAYATVAPRHFYDEFLLGRGWVAADGPFNEHLIRDFASLNLAIGVVALCTVVWTVRPLVIATGLAWLVYMVPHLGYHVLNLHPYDTTDSTLVVGGLIGPGVVALVVLLVGLREPRAARRRRRQERE
jgi:hypothetical protein